jgi:hypothetical protein
MKRRRPRRDDAERRFRAAVIDDGGQGPAGERGRLALEHDERVLIVTLARVA